MQHDQAIEEVIGLSRGDLEPAFDKCTVHLYLTDTSVSGIGLAGTCDGICIARQPERVGEEILMRLGAGYPTLDFGGNPNAIRQWAEAVEGLWFNHILAFEHVAGFNTRDIANAFGLLRPHTCFDEPFVLFGFLAAVTGRIELATGVLVLPQRQTVLVAKQAAEVDALSGGRLRLGIGIGGVPEEFALLNENYHNRGRRADEQVEVLRALWTEQPVSFEGRWHRLEQTGISPLPVQRPIPIWIGSHAEPGLRRIGRLADGWLPVIPSVAAAEQLKPKWQVIAEAARAAGRDPACLGIDAQVLYSWIPESGWREFGLALQDFGVTHLTVTTMGLSASVDDHIAALRYVRDELSRAGLVDQPLRS